MKFKAVNIPISDAETLISLLDSNDNAVCNTSLEYLTKFAEICKYFQFFNNYNIKYI